MYVCLLACVCVSKREEGPLTLCKKDSCGLQEGFWCCASSLMHFLSSRAATLGNYDDDCYATKTKLTALKAMPIQKLGWIREEGRLPPNKVVVMHFSVYFLCTIYPTTNNEWRPPGLSPVLYLYFLYFDTQLYISRLNFFFYHYIGTTVSVLQLHIIPPDSTL